MKDSGFTLIELLGVILLISLLAAVSYPIVLKVFDEKTEEIDQMKLDLIYNAAKNYAKLNLSGDTCVFVEDLINENLIAVEVDDYDLIKSKSIVELVMVNNIYNTSLTDFCTTSEGIEYQVISDCKNIVTNDNYNIENERMFYFKDNILFREQDFIEIKNLNKDNNTSYLNQINNYISLASMLNYKGGIVSSYIRGDVISKINIDIDFEDVRYSIINTTEEDIIYGNTPVFEQLDINQTYNNMETFCS